jgi:hypothetical protein
MHYTPNFNDPRIIKRCKQALGFVISCMDDKKPRAWYTRQIDKNFGKQNNPLSKYLRHRLLRTVDDSYDMFNGKCKTYVYKAEGVEFIKASISTKTNNETVIKTNLELAIEWATINFKDQLETLNFEYNDKENRQWNPIQNMKSDYRAQLLRSYGMNFSYDIECAAPTLIYQHSRSIKPIQNEKGKYIQYPNDLWMEALEHYLANKKTVRIQIAKEADMTYKEVKEMINSLFAGAVLAKNPKTAVYQLIDYDKAKMLFLQQHEYLTALRDDIKLLWNYIKPTMPVSFKEDKNGNVRKTAMTSKKKWDLYFQLERTVMNSVQRYLECKQIKFFIEHDGWTSDKAIDVVDLCDYVYYETGFDLVLKEVAH